MATTVSSSSATSTRRFQAVPGVPGQGAIFIPVVAVGPSRAQAGHVARPVVGHAPAVALDIRRHLVETIVAEGHLVDNTFPTHHHVVVGGLPFHRAKPVADSLVASGTGNALHPGKDCPTEPLTRPGWSLLPAHPIHPEPRQPDPFVIGLFAAFVEAHDGAIGQSAEAGVGTRSGVEEA